MLPTPFRYINKYALINTKVPWGMNTPAGWRIRKKSIKNSMGNKNILTYLLARLWRENVRMLIKPSNPTCNKQGIGLSL